MGNTQVCISEDTFSVILYHFREYKDMEFHEFHNLACTTVLFSQLISVKFLKVQYDLYYPFQKIELTDKQITEFVKKDELEEDESIFISVTDIMLQDTKIGEVLRFTFFEHWIDISLKYEYVGTVTTTMFSDEVLDKLSQLSAASIQIILSFIYKKYANKRWRGKELALSKINFYAPQKNYLKWNHVNYTTKYTPKIVVENEVKFMYEFIRCFKTEIEACIMKI